MLKAAMAAGLVFFFLFMLWALLWVLVKTVRILTKSEERRKLKEYYRNEAVLHSSVQLWLLEIGFIIFVLTGIGILLIADQSDIFVIAVGILITLLFGYSSIAIGFMIWVKRGFAREQDLSE